MCNTAAEYGHLNALKYLRTELQCEWNPCEVLKVAAMQGHVHILQWAIENGASLVLPDAAATVSFHEQLVGYSCVDA